MNRQERLTQTLLWFLSHPSVTGDERQLCDALQTRIEALSGWEVHRISNNLIVTAARRDPARRLIAFAGHLDTVPEPPVGITVRIEEDRIHGRGASDMKAGDTVMLELLETFPWDESRVDPVFLFYEREEGPYSENGLEAVFEELPWVLDADLAFCLEPTSNQLEVGCVGTAHVEVTFKGVPAHSARPWEGENAITKAGALMQELHERPPLKVDVEGLAFYEVLTPTMARGGLAKNVVPEEFWININYRFAPGRTLAEVESVFQALLEGRAEYLITDFAPSGPVNLENPLLQKFIQQGEIQIRPKQAWTDVARFAAHGVSAVNFGPGLPAQAHQQDEYTLAPMLLESYERFARFLSAL